MWGMNVKLVTRSIGGINRITRKIKHSVPHQSRALPYISAMSTTADISKSSQCDAALIPGFFRWIERCNDGEAAQATGEFLPFQVDNQTVGYLQEK